MDTRGRTFRRLTGPGSRFILLGVVLLILSAGTLVSNSAGQWLHDTQRPSAPPTEALPQQFNLATPPAVQVAPARP